MPVGGGWGWNPAVQQHRASQQAPVPTTRHNGQGVHRPDRGGGSSSGGSSRPGSGPGTGGIGRGAPGNRDPHGNRGTPVGQQSPPADTGPSMSDPAIQYGMEFLPPELYQVWLEAFIETGDADYALRIMRRDPSYEQYFAGNFDSDSGLVMMSEAEYVAYRMEVGNLLGDYEVADHFNNPEFIGEWVAGGLSLNEIRQRLEAGQAAAQTADPGVVAELERLYGATPGDLVAYMLDPDVAQSVLEGRFRSAQLSAIGVNSGFGQLDQGQAERLRGMGVSDSAARQGFSALVRQRPLFQPLLGVSDNTVGQDEQLGAVFGSDAAALLEIQRERQKRLAQFQGGGGAAVSATQFAGFRSSTS